MTLTRSYDPQVAGDGDLVVAARGGDQGAFAAIYDRYADRLHDFCHSVLRDRHEAADAMQDTFVLASQRLGQLRDPEKLRPWLFSIARHESLRRAKARGRATPTEDAGVDVAAAGATPEELVSASDATAIVWDAAAGLSERDRVLLDLHLRQGLEGQELADAIGTTADQAYVLMSRLRDQVERSIGALLVARLGRADCEQLQAVLEDWDGKFSTVWRKRVARHVDDCEICSEKRKAFLSPLALLAAVPLVPAPALLRDQTLDRVRNVSNVRPLRGWRRPSARDGFPPSMFRQRRRMPIAAVAAVAVVVGVALLAEPFGRGGGDAEVAVKTPEAEHTTTTSTTVAPTTTTAAATSTTQGTRRSVAPPPPPPSDVSGPALSVSQQYSCSNSFSGSNAITATASDPGGVASVTMVASGSPNPPTGYTSTLVPSGGAYVGHIDWGNLGTYSWTVTAVDALGHSSTKSGSFAVQTTPC